jgi:RNA polymerase sigma factor (TIGR02999 family)
MSDSETTRHRPEQITRLLADWNAGDNDAGETLSAIVYQRLREIAAGQMSQESRQLTLQPTALVHEVVLQLLDNPPECESREHLFALAARMMRNYLVNQAKRRMTKKRGGEVVRVEFHEEGIAARDPGIDVLALDQALNELESRDPRKRELIELHYFGGLSYDEMARATGRSRATVHRDLRMARAFVSSRLNPEPAS